MRGFPLICIWKSGPARDSCDHAGFRCFILCSSLCHYVRSTNWPRIVSEVPLRVLSDVNYVYLMFGFSFLYPARPPYAPVLICPSTIVRHPFSEHWLKRRPCRILRAWFYWCLGYTWHKSKLVISDTAHIGNQRKRQLSCECSNMRIACEALSSYALQKKKTVHHVEKHKSS